MPGPRCRDDPPIRVSFHRRLPVNEDTVSVTIRRGRAINCQSVVRWLSSVVVLAACVAILIGASVKAAAPTSGESTSLMTQAERILEALERADYAVVAEHVDPSCGLGFSPYVRDLAELFVAKVAHSDLPGLAHSTVLRTWGTYDGIGSPITLVPHEYHSKFVYDVDYRKKAIRTYFTANRLKVSPGWSALVKAYAGASVVRFEVPGTAIVDYKDRKAMLLVFLQTGPRWVLVGIAHDEDTV